MGHVAPLSGFDRELVRKYDRPGPRYTSYPSVPHFRDSFGVGDHEDLLTASGRAAPRRSLYLHIPFCETRCFFCGCNVIISRDRARARRYRALIEAEMDLAARRLGDGRAAVQLHWGGGTPTFLPAAEIVRLADAVRRRFALDADLEFGVEVDPRHCSDDQLDALAEAGVNRLSLGVQDVDARVQEAVNRRQPIAESRRVIAGARGRGISSVNVDLIYGLPHQSEESFAATVDEVVSWSPDRLAVFNFAYLPQLFPHQRTLDPASLPGPEIKLKLLEETVRRLIDAGYLFIGMDHFAKPEDPLAVALEEGSLTRNFQGYSTCGDTDLVAFGASAISQVGDGYAQNHKVLAHYEQAITAGRLATARGLRLSAEDRLRRDVILRIMGSFRLEKAQIEARHRIDFDSTFAAELEALRPLADDGLLELADDRLAVTPVGRLLVRNIAMVFDAYLGTGAAARYSRTV